jgi:hypothetical protein
MNDLSTIENRIQDLVDKKNGLLKIKKNHRSNEMEFIHERINRLKRWRISVIRSKSKQNPHKRPNPFTKQT